MNRSALGHVLDEMAAHHGVTTQSRARAFGLDTRSQRRAVAAGIVWSPAPGVLAAVGAPDSWQRRIRIATSTVASPVLAHRSAARLHGLLDGSDRDPIDVIILRGRHPARSPGVWHHVTRGPRTGVFDEHVVDLDGVPTLRISAVLALLAPVVGTTLTADALGRALDAGLTISSARETATAWQRRGRPGPTTLHRLLDEIEGARLGDAWIDQLGRMLGREHGLRTQRDVPIGSEAASVVVDLALVDHRVGIRRVEAARHTAPRPGPDGWRILEVSWRDRDRRVHLVRTLVRMTARPAVRRSAA